MREFLEDAEAHRNDGYRDAQKHAGRQLPKRFYKEVGVAPVDGGFAVTLDGKTPLTPGRIPVVVPVAAIATAMAAEWSAQGEEHRPHDHAAGPAGQLSGRERRGQGRRRCATRS